MEQCKITAIANQKGGVGKTVTTFNLGVGLARAGQRVLLVDADPQGSLTISMGIKAPDDLDTTITSLMQATIDDRLPPDGFGMKQIQEWLGHSDFSTTANVYAHLDYNSKKFSAEAMQNGLKDALIAIS